jgi:hypothetical protein
MFRSIPWRSLLALVLAAWTPFCCCNLHTLLSVCEPCGHRGHCCSDADNEHDGGGADHGFASGAHDHDGDTSPAPSDQSRHDKKPCRCESQKQTSIGLDKNTIEFAAPAMLYILPSWDLAWAPRWSLMPRSRANASPLIPDTSLLRQHCALVV